MHLFETMKLDKGFIPRTAIINVFQLLVSI